MAGDWTYKPGQWWIICDVCGKKIKSGDAKQRWDGFVVCPSDFEQRHPQDFVKARQDKISVSFTRPRPQDVFVDVSYITLYIADDYIQKGYFEEL